MDNEVKLAYVIKGKEIKKEEIENGNNLSNGKTVSDKTDTRKGGFKNG